MKYLDYIESKQHGTSDFPVAYYYVDSTHPYYQMPYHWHTECEILRIIQGTFHLTLDGQSINATTHDVIFIQAGSLHGGIPEDCIYECIVFDMKLLLSNNKLCNTLIQRLISHEIVISCVLPIELASLKSTIDDLFHALRMKEIGYEFEVQGKFYSLLGILCESQLLETDSNKPTASLLQVRRLKDALNYIEENYTQPISLDDIAHAAGLNPRYFCRFFRKMTQSTPTEYLNFFRIECACEQLTNSQISITDVALNCGFNDISYFIKIFHKNKGVTPKQYRESNRQYSKRFTIQKGNIGI